MSTDPVSVNRVEATRIPIIRTYPVVNLKLRPLVQTIWSLESELPCTLPGIIAPDAQVEFVFFLAGHGFLRLHGPGERWKKQPRAFFYTQIKGCIEIATSKNVYFIAFRTNQATAQQLLGELLLQRGEAEEAARIFRRSVGLNPGAALLRRNLARALQRLEKTEEAEAELEKARQIDTRNEPQQP